MSVQYTTDGPIAVVTIDRPECRTAVDRFTADALEEVFRTFDADAIRHELRRGMATMASGETAAGASAFPAGGGCHGSAAGAVQTPGT